MSFKNSSIKSYEIKVSKTGLKVPVVNGVHLHSIYNPMKEAESFIELNFKGPEIKNYLFFGLGFGYHISALLKKLKEHKVQARIVVIEPNPTVTYDCIELDLINQDDIYLVVNQTPQQIYSNKDLTRFLLKKPQIVSHPSSFNLYSDYYRELLSYEASESKEDIISSLQSPTLQEYLKDQEGETYTDIINSLKERRSFSSDLDLLALALDKITDKSQQLTHG